LSELQISSMMIKKEIEGIKSELKIEHDSEEVEKI
jgi:galactitol-specific phosphotransferase system IIB component